MLLGDKATLKEVHDHIAVLSDTKDLLGVNIERRKLIVRWLYVFGYSNRETLLKLTNAKGSTGYRFIADLIRHGYIQKFKNNFYSKDLLMLGKQGLGVLLEDRIINTDQAKLPNKRKFIDSSRVHHEVGLHKSVLAYLLRQINTLKLSEISKEVRYKPLMVDALLQLEVVKTGETLKVAIEYERTEKSRQRIEYLLVEHMKNIKNNHYNAVAFYFTNKTLHDFYLKIMLEQPREWFKKKNGSFYGGDTYKITKNIRNRLIFSLLDSENTKIATLEHIEQDETHILHSHLADIRRRQENDRIVAKEAEDERREQIRDELRPIIEKELLEQQTPIIEAKIREEIRLEEEARQKQMEDEKFFNQMRGLFKKE